MAQGPGATTIHYGRRRVYPDEPPSYTRSMAQEGEGELSLEKALAVKDRPI